jgi:hypothetical protein
VLLVFKAGPPYEDIAFKIVNGEWMIGECHVLECCFNACARARRQTIWFSLQVSKWCLVVVVQFEILSLPQMKVQSARRKKFSARGLFFS